MNYDFKVTEYVFKKVYNGEQKRGLQYKLFIHIFYWFKKKLKKVGHGNCTVDDSSFQSTYFFFI